MQNIWVGAGWQVQIVGKLLNYNNLLIFFPVRDFLKKDTNH